MTPNLETDLLRSFIAIAELGSCTRAAEEVRRTQPAVSMQMKRLEEMLDRPLFDRAGRNLRLTADGKTFLGFARRIVKLSEEAVTGLARREVAGTVRLGTIDDYADRLLPDILTRFSRSHPRIEVDVACLARDAVLEGIRHGKFDLALVTCVDGTDDAKPVRSEPLVWVGSSRHRIHEQEVLPLALCHAGCEWRRQALAALGRAGRRYRIVYASVNSNAVNAAVLSGLAVGAIPGILVRGGMRILGEDDGLPALGRFDLGLVRAPGESTPAVDALARHIEESLARLERASIAA